MDKGNKPLVPLLFLDKNYFKHRFKSTNQLDHASPILTDLTLPINFYDFLNFY